MFSIGIYIYGIPLLLASFYAIYKKERCPTIVSAVLLAAFILTRTITMAETDPRYMLDMLNDLAVMVILLFWLGKNNLLVRCLAVSYAVMTFGGYIPLAMETMTQKTSDIVLEALGILHIIVIIGGAKYGPRIRIFEQLRNRDPSSGGLLPDVVRPLTGMRSSFDEDGTLHIKGDI